MNPTEMIKTARHIKTTMGSPGESVELSTVLRLMIDHDPTLATVAIEAIDLLANERRSDRLHERNRLIEKRRSIDQAIESLTKSATELNSQIEVIEKELVGDAV